MNNDKPQQDTKETKEIARDNKYELSAAVTNQRETQPKREKQ